MKFETQVMPRVWPILSRSLPVKRLALPVLMIAIASNAMAKDGKSTLAINNKNIATVMQQGETITGTVTDATGQGLPGVTVRVKGTTTAAVTGIDGKYSIAVPNRNAVLAFSIIGFENYEAAVGSGRVVDARLKEVVNQLNEIVVVGYGEQRKATLTGSVSTVGGKEINNSPAANVTSSLAGKLPGLIVNQRSGEPGRDDPSILIRGNGTFNTDNGGSNPLIIIDGVERTLLGRLNPDDIESISVLKDASAAIYGARAANGVILVTTKRGTKGKPVFDFSYDFGLSSPTKIPQMLDAATFATALNEAKFASVNFNPQGFVPVYTDADIQAYRNGSDPVTKPNTNWAAIALKNHTYQKGYNMSVNGGSDNVRYVLSYGRITNDGILVNDPTKVTQNNFRVKVDVDVNKYLNIGANISGSLTDKKYSVVGTNVNFVDILQAPPTLVGIYPNGLLGGGRLGESTLLLNQRGYETISDNPLYSTFTATLKIPYVDGLKLDASYNFDMSNVFDKTFAQPYFYYQYNTATKNYDRAQGTGTASISVNDRYDKYRTILYNFRLSYDHNFGQHHVGGMIGSEQQQNNHSFASAFRKGLLSNAIPEVDQGSTAIGDFSNGGSSDATARNNYFGRFNYDFASKYLLEFVFRYDGSILFPKNDRYGFFPAISAGWRLSEEKFIKDNFKFVNQLKLRATYGQLGNDRFNSPYAYLQTFGSGGGNNYVFGSSDVIGISANTIPNPNFTWERSRKTDLGLEAVLWNGLLGVDFTLWKEDRSNILATRNFSVSKVFGFTNLPPENIGKSENHGYELIVSHRNNIGKLGYNIRASLSYQRSKVVFRDEVPHKYSYQDATGHPVGAQLVYKTDGIFHTQAELDSYPHDGSTKLGDLRIVDLNGDKVINADDSYMNDYNNVPKYITGLNMDFTYGNFDLNIFLQGQMGAYAVDNTFRVLGTADQANASVSRAADRWSVTNPNGTMPRADSYNIGNNDFFFFNRSFVRLKTVQLGYSLPKEIVSKLKISNLRFYMSGFNLLTWSKQIKWADPELNGDYTAYPPSRIVNFGVNVKF